MDTIEMDEISWPRNPRDTLFDIAMTCLIKQNNYQWYRQNCLAAYEHQSDLHFQQMILTEQDLPDFRKHCQTFLTSLAQFTRLKQLLDWASYCGVKETILELNRYFSYYAAAKYLWLDTLDLYLKASAKDFMHYILEKHNYLNPGFYEILQGFLMDKCLYDNCCKDAMLQALVSCYPKTFENQYPDFLFDVFNRITAGLIEEYPALKDRIDCENHTALHVLMEFIFGAPLLGEKFMTIIPLLTTKMNVNALDKFSVTPHSWILFKKLNKNIESDVEKILLDIEKIFLNEGADAEKATYGYVAFICAGLSGFSHTWYHNLDKMQKMLNFLKFLPYIKSDHNSKEIDDLIISTAEKVAISISPHGMTYADWEILCLCLDNGAKLKMCNGLDDYYVLADDITYTIARSEELAILQLKLLSSLHKDKRFKCKLSLLENSYVISESMLELGKQLGHKMYDTLKQCLQSQKLMDYLLFISDDVKNAAFLASMEDMDFGNWLQRSPLHLAVIVLNQEKMSQYIPKGIIEKYIDARDVQGCTPLHIAHLHNNTQAIDFLISHGARQDVTDHFGVVPKSLKFCSKMASGMCRGETESCMKEEHLDDKHYRLCSRVLETKSGVFEQIRPMLIMSETEANNLSRELQTLFERLLKDTDFSTAHAEIGGSLRERLKVGRLDEADIQIKLSSHNIDADSLYGCLRMQLTHISWNDISLRPVFTGGPWKFIREGPSFYRGLEISVDVVIINMHTEKAGLQYHYGLKETVVENSPEHKRMTVIMPKEFGMMRSSFSDTEFAYEWDILDSLPTSCRLAIVISKALVQAYDWCKNDSLRIKLPITSYLIKTALFYILSGKSLDPVITAALSEINAEDSGKINKIKFNPKPKWATDADLDEHAEEARIWAGKIFAFINFLAKERCLLSSYWPDWATGIHHLHPCASDDVSEPDAKMYIDETDWICEICDFLLERLRKDTFYGNA